MSVEYILLHSAPIPVSFCPKCLATPFEPFLRGQIQRARRTLFSWPPFKLRPYCTLICRACKKIVGHEMPPDVKHNNTTPIRGLWKADH